MPRKTADVPQETPEKTCCCTHQSEPLKECGNVATYTNHQEQHLCGPCSDGECLVSRETSGPPPMLSGTFAIFELPDGGVLLSTWTQEYGDQRVPIPAFIVKRGLAMAGGGEGMIGRFLGRFGGG